MPAKKEEISAESEIKKIETEVEEKVAEAEAKAEEEVKAVEAKAEEVVSDVEEEVKKVVDKVEGKTTTEAAPEEATAEEAPEPELSVDGPTALRETAVAVMNLLVAEKAFIDYRQLRPMSTRSITSVSELLAALKNRVKMDCSESVTLIAHVSGWRDPSAAGFDGYGDTETILANKSLKHFTDPKEANACSLVVFNADKPLSAQHVAIVHTADQEGGNPLLFSHGTQGDPSFITLKNLQSAFAGKTVFVAVSNLTETAVL